MKVKRTWWRGFLRVVLLCQGIGLAIALVLHLYGRVGPFAATVAISVIYSNLSWGGIHLIAYLFRMPWRENRPWDTVFILKSIAIFFLGLTLGLHLGNVICSALFPTLTIPPFFSMMNLFITFMNLGAAVVVVLIIALYKNLKYRLERRNREYMELATLQVKTRLAALQAKLNPHFLFNTLNVILDLAEKAPEKIEPVVLNLSDIYRTVLDQGAGDKGTLGDELELVRKYLEIEKIRLGRRLDYAIDCLPALAAHPLPPLLLEPLVENAVIHGICPKAAGGGITIRAAAVDGKLRIDIRDSGAGYAPSAAHTGFGLQSVRERLHLLYGPAAAMTIAPAKGGGTRVCVEVPLAS